MIIVRVLWTFRSDLLPTYLNGRWLLKLLHDYCVYVLEPQKPSSTYLKDRWILRRSFTCLYDN